MKCAPVLTMGSVALAHLVQSNSTDHPGLKTGQFGPKKPDIHPESLKKT